MGDYICPPATTGFDVFSVLGLPVKEIQASETFTIPARREMAIHGLLILDGVLLIVGCLVMEI